MNKYFWTMESWGADYPPENAEEIIGRANSLIADFIEKNPFCGTDEIEMFSESLWEKYCAGKF